MGGGERISTSDLGGITSMLKVNEK